MIVRHTVMSDRQSDQKDRQTHLNSMNRGKGLETKQERGEIINNTADNTPEETRRATAIPLFDWSNNLFTSFV